MHQLMRVTTNEYGFIVYLNIMVFWMEVNTVIGGSLRLDTYPNPAKYIKKNP